MTLRWIEGFELFGNTTSFRADLEAKYPSASGTSSQKNTSIAANRFGGAAYWSTSSSSDQLETPAFAAQTTWVVGFAFHCIAFEASTPTADPILQIVDGSTVHVELRPNASTSSEELLIDIKNGDGTTLATSSPISRNAWHYIELKVAIDDSAGQVVLRIDETEDINLSSQDTRNGGNATADRVRLYSGWNDGSDALVLDDWYVCDGSGSENNDFLGDCHVEGVLPAGAGDSTGWTPDSGSNYQRVDDSNGPDDDSSYIESETVAEKDLYSIGNLSRITGNIVGIQVNAVGRNTGATTRTVKNVIKSGTTEEAGPSHAFSSTSYEFSTSIHEKNPDTVADWTPTEINSMQIGIELES